MSPLPFADFLSDCAYTPEGALVTELLVVDRDSSLVTCRMPTHAELPLTRLQRVHPTRHPRHVNGGLLLHASAMVGMAHAFYCFDIRHADGWIGYGARAQNVRFKNMAVIGPPIDITCVCTGFRRGDTNMVGRYAYTMNQGDTVVYQSEQTGAFMKTQT